MTSSSSSVVALWLCFLGLISTTTMAFQLREPVGKTFQKNFLPTWAADHIKYYKGGHEVELYLDYRTGSGFQSKRYYLVGGYVSMQIKMVPRNSAGVVAAFYGSKHDEIDFEFLGNRDGKHVLLQTNLFTSGQGNREQRIHLWFDPTKNYHYYSVLWNRNLIAFFVDDTPIRVFKNSKKLGVGYPSNQPIRVHCNLWNASDWATDGGRLKVDWSKAPFVAGFRGFNIAGCRASAKAKICATQGRNWWDRKEFQDLDGNQYKRLREVRKKYTLYNYCTDRKNHPTVPPECKRDGDV